MAFAAVAAIAAGVTAVSGVVKMFQGASKQRQARLKNKEAIKRMEADKERYLNQDTSNPYLNMENTMEDLTVNTQAAEFQAESNARGMADTLSSMNKAAGGSGVAALAQALANQGAIANQKASISIAEQEKANQTAARAEASKLQGLEREGEIQSRNLKAKMAGEMLRLSAGEVAGTSAEIARAGDEIAGGLGTVATGIGSLANQSNPI